MDEKEFEKLVAAGVDAIPKRFTDKLNNVVIVVEEEPTLEQLKRSRVRPGWTLFGLYEGIPQTKRANYTMVLPDKISIFKGPIERSTNNPDEIKIIVRNTVWHEIAHHFGMDEAEVRRAEAKRRLGQAR